MNNPSPNSNDLSNAYLSKDRVIMALGTLIVVITGWVQTMVLTSFREYQNNLEVNQSELNELRIEVAKISTLLEEARNELKKDRED